jgi:integrase/recombinase XerD
MAASRQSDEARARRPGRAPDPPPAVARFLQDLRVERGISAHTAAAYRRDLAVFFAHIGDRPLERIGTEELVDFLAARAGAGDGRRTRARRTAALRSFFRFLAAQGRIPRNPAALLPAPRLDSLLPRALPLRHTQALFDATAAGAGPEALRDRLLLELLYSAGLRVSEACGTTLDSIDPRARLVEVIGKGGRQRRVPAGASVIEACVRYLKEGRPSLARPDSGRALLLLRSGRPLDRRAAWRIVRRLGRSAGLGDAVHPHALRHSFATDLVRGGADLRSVQELLGHASIDTTQVYTGLADERLREVHRRHHPRG